MNQRITRSTSAICNCLKTKGMQNNRLINKFLTNKMRQFTNTIATILRKFKNWRTKKSLKKIFICSFKATLTLSPLVLHLLTTYLLRMIIINLLKWSVISAALLSLSGSFLSSSWSLLLLPYYFKILILLKFLTKVFNWRFLMKFNWRHLWYKIHYTVL